MEIVVSRTTAWSGGGSGGEGSPIGDSNGVGVEKGSATGEPEGDSTGLAIGIVVPSGLRGRVSLGLPSGSVVISGVPPQPDRKRPR